MRQTTKLFPSSLSEPPPWMLFWFKKKKKKNLGYGFKSVLKTEVHGEVNLLFTIFNLGKDWTDSAKKKKKRAGQHCTVNEPTVKYQVEDYFSI